MNGKGFFVLFFLEKKFEDNFNNRKFLNKRLLEREFDFDIYCGVIDFDIKKFCIWFLICKIYFLI